MLAADQIGDGGFIVGAAKIGHANAVPNLPTAIDYEVVILGRRGSDGGAACTVLASQALGLPVRPAHKVLEFSRDCPCPRSPPMRRRDFVTFVARAAALWPATTLAQQSTGKVWRVAYLHPTGSLLFDVFRAEMRELGLHRGQEPCHRYQDGRGESRTLTFADE